jgi:hypothetical protein
MKKAYSKPEIFFEDFSLSTNIAAGCELFPNFAEDACGVKWGKKHIFLAEIQGCGTKIVNGDPTYDGACYHNPSDPNVFNS